MPRIDRVAVNGIEINVASAGVGPAVVLIHGFPHTWRLWSSVIPALSRSARVIAPDLRGLGDSTRAASGYDLATLGSDLSVLLDEFGVERAAVVGIDLGGPVAFHHALSNPAAVRCAVLIECLLGRLPGAEGFLADGPPWWFGFHSVPGLAETVLEGHESEYVGWFLENGTADKKGVPAAIRDAFVDAYSGRESLACAFRHYRAMPGNGKQLVDALRDRRLTVPTMAIGAKPIGSTLAMQLEPVADDLSSHLIEDCGHIVPLEQPAALLELIEPFLARHP
ncbi:MAG TPA: alpha/beta hydrolase [Solirubrobacterales bacterium]|nr:alpha/beta hydrolase [Solirubrobacterales bacterium]